MDKIATDFADTRLNDAPFINTPFIDTHCHFDFPPFVGAEIESLAQAAAAGVSRIIVPAVSADRFERVLRLAQQHSAVSAALGLHPIYSHTADDLAKLAERLAEHHHDVVAIGEIGLDFFIESANPTVQIAQLKAQLALANRYDLPVILHSRRAHDVLARELKIQPVTRGGVVHGFAGSLEQAQRFIRLGYAIGVGGVITYERAKKTRQALAQLPLTSLLLETDSPDMPVSGYQGQPNRPERLTQIFAALCKIRPESPAEIAAQIYKNSLSLFGLNRLV